MRFNIATSDNQTVDPVNQASAGSDYVAKSANGLTIPVGQTSKTFIVTLNGDTAVEANEVFDVTLANAVGATIFDDLAWGKLINDDGPRLTVSGASVTEGDVGTKLLNFTVNLSEAALVPVTYNITSLALDTASAGSDFVANTLTGETIAIGETSRNFSVTINGDTTVESNERLLALLSNASGASVFNDRAWGTITNDDVSGFQSVQASTKSFTSISAIQGSGSISPLLGRTVRTEGWVTALTRDGFFMQSGVGEQDDDVASSEAIYVQTSKLTKIDVGQRVSVSGEVQEAVVDGKRPQFTRSQVKSTQVQVLTAHAALPAPLSLDRALTQVISPYALERFEGMRIAANDLKVVGPSGGEFDESTGNVSSDGVFYVVSGSRSRPFREPGIDATNATGQEKSLALFDGNPERLRIRSRGQRGALAVSADAGDRVRGLVGVLDEGAGVYSVLPDPRSHMQVTAGSQPAAVSRKAANDISMGSLPLGRFFDDVNDPQRDEPVMPKKVYALRLAKAANAICAYADSPDVLGVSGVESESVLSDLASATNERVGNVLFPQACQNDPHYRAYMGSVGSGLNLGFLVSTAEVLPGVPRVQVLATTPIGEKSQFRHPNGRSETLFEQAPMAVRTRIAQNNGKSLEVVTVMSQLHTPNNQAVEQMGWDNQDDYDRAKRRQQAMVLAAWIKNQQTLRPNDRIVVMGDFQTSEFHDGVDDVLGLIAGRSALRQGVLQPAGLSNPLVDLTALMPKGQRYSVTKDGNAQA
ncbi:MAG: Calx-beta domain-containing protein, partial [Arenimonas sp.]